MIFFPFKAQLTFLASSPVKLFDIDSLFKKCNAKFKFIMIYVFSVKYFYTEILLLPPLWDVCVSLSSWQWNKGFMFWGMWIVVPFIVCQHLKYALLYWKVGQAWFRELYLNKWRFLKRYRTKHKICLKCQNFEALSKEKKNLKFIKLK